MFADELCSSTAHLSHYLKLEPQKDSNLSYCEDQQTKQCVMFLQILGVEVAGNMQLLNMYRADEI